jgi:hydrogenase-4 component E
MHRLAELVLLLVLLVNFSVLAASRLSFCIRAMAAQGLLLALLPLTLGEPFSIQLLVLVVGTALVKAVLLPRFLAWAIREVEVRREVSPPIGPIGSLLLGIVALAVGLFVGSRLPETAMPTSHLLAPTALTTLISGFLILTGRRQALMQVIGYLMLENGVFIFGLELHRQVPLLVELGVLLDVFVGVFIMGLVVFQMNRELDTLDAPRQAGEPE